MSVVPPYQTIVLSSQHRIAGTISDAVYQTLPISNARRAQLMNFTIINNAYAIPAGTSFLVSEGGPPVAVTLSAGSPNAVQLAADVQAQLNAAGLAGVFTVTADLAALTLTITSTVAFALSWPTTGSASYAMGWGRVGAATGAALSHTSPFTMAAVNPSKIAIAARWGVSGSGPVWTSANVGGTWVVDVDSEFGSVYQYRPMFAQEGMVCLNGGDWSTLSLRLLDAATGAAYDTRGADYQIAISFWL